MFVAFPQTLSQIAASGRIGPEDVRTIRRIIYGDGGISAYKASWLFSLNQSAREQCEEWRAFFIKALNDYTSPRPHQGPYDG